MSEPIFPDRAPRTSIYPTRLASQDLLKLALGGVAVSYAVLFATLALLRVSHPFELEWLEGGSLEHVRRVLSGERLYGPPSLEFTPFFYPPLYYYVAAAFARVLGPGFLPLRLVSLAASLGCLALIFSIVRRETGNAFAALLGGCLFAATYRLSGAWLDVARVDPLFTFWLLLGATLARGGRRPAAPVLAAACLVAALLTKQTALPVAAALAVPLLQEHRRRAWAFPGTLLVLGGGAFLALDAASDGWFRYYVLVAPSRHPLAWRRLASFFTRDLFAPLAIACVAAAAYLLWRPAREGWRFYAWLTAGMATVSLLSRMNVGGYDNVLLPVYAVVAILFGLGVDTLQEALGGSLPSSRKRFERLLWAACLVQFTGLAYNPLLQVPSRRDRDAVRALEGLLAGIQGDIFLPGHPYLLTRAGKASHAHFSALNEALNHGSPEVQRALASQIREALAQRRFSALVLDSPEWFRPYVEPHYRDAGPVFPDPTAFWPVTGARFRPERIYRPRMVAPAVEEPSAGRPLPSPMPAQSTKTRSSGR